MSRDFKGAIADNLPYLIAPTGGPLLYKYVYTYIHPITVPWNHDGILQSTRQSVPLIDVLILLLHSRNSCICPEIMSTNNIPRRARPVEQNSNITFKQNCSKNLRIFQFSNYLSSASCDELCCKGSFCMIHIPMRSSHNFIVYTRSGKQGIFFRPHRGILNTAVQEYRHSFFHNCYYKYFIRTIQCQEERPNKIS